MIIEMTQEQGEALLNHLKRTLNDDVLIKLGPGQKLTGAVVAVELAVLKGRA